MFLSEMVFWRPGPGPPNRWTRLMWPGALPAGTIKTNHQNDHPNPAATDPDRGRDLPFGASVKTVLSLAAMAAKKKPRQFPAGVSLETCQTFGIRSCAEREPAATRCPAT